MSKLIRYFILSCALSFIVQGTMLYAQHSPYQIREQLTAGNTEQAMRLCNQALRESKNANTRAEILFLLGTAQSKANQKQEALRTWARLTASTVTGVPDTWAAEALLASARLRSSDKTTQALALQNYRDFIRRWPKNDDAPVAIWEASRLRRNQGKLKEALKELDAWRSEYAKHPLSESVEKERKELERLIRTKSVSVSSTDISSQLANAKNLAAKGKHTEAIRIMREALSRTTLESPAYWAIHQGMLVSLDALGDTALSLHSAKILAENKNCPPQIRHKALFDFGRLTLEMGDSPARAEIALRQHLESGKNTKEDTSLANWYLIISLLRQRKHDEARKIFETLGLEETEDPNANPFHRLSALLDTKKGLGGEDILGKLTSATRFTQMADSFFSILEWRKAAHYYQTAGKNTTSLTEQAYCLLQEARSLAWGDSNEQQRALVLYTRFSKEPALQKTHWAAPALHRAAIFCIGTLDDTKRGLDFFEQILRIAPRSPEAEEALFNSAIFYFWNEKWTEAQKRFEELLKKFPNTEYKEVVTKEYLPVCKKTPQNNTNTNKAKEKK